MIKHKNNQDVFEMNTENGKVSLSITNEDCCEICIFEFGTRKQAIRVLGKFIHYLKRLEAKP